MSQPHVTSNSASAAIDFVLRRAPEALPRLLAGLDRLAGVEEKDLRDYLCREGGVVPVPIFMEMLRRAREDIFHDPRAPFLIGFEMMAYHHWDPARALFLRLLGAPERAARMILWLARRFAKVVTSAQCRDISPTGCNLVIDWNPASGVTRDMCLFYQGGASALPLTWGGRPATVEERTCAFAGDESCVIALHWEPFTWRDRWRALTMTLPGVRQRFLVEILRRHGDARSNLGARLQLAESSYRAMIAAASDAIVEVMPDGRVNPLNQAALDLAGAKSPDDENLKVANLLHPEEMGVILDRQRRRLAGEEVPSSYRLLVQSLDGRCVPVHGGFSLVEDPVRGRLVLGILRDVSQEEKLARALEDERQRFMRLAEFSPLGLAIVDERGRYLYLNPAFTAMFGYTLEHFQTGRQWFRLAFPDQQYRRKSIGVWKEDSAAAGQGQMPPHTFKVLCQDGSSKDVLFRPVSLAQGERIIVFEDVTERLAADKTLRENEARLRTIVEGSPEAILLLDGRRGVLKANGQAEGLLGLAHPEPAGSPDSPILARVLEKIWDRLMAEGKVAEEVFLEPAEAGSGLALEVTGLALGPELVHLSLRDIGPRLRLEAERQEAARLGGVVETAGAAAHELNQPLTSLLATVEMMEIYQDPANLRRLAGKARAEVERLAELVARLGKIVRYESQPYLGDTRIIDLKKSSQEE
jgi:PAS domain S-box-containing protein